MNELDARFLFLYDQLKGIYADYSQYVFSTTTAILLIMGWLLTSEAARGYIAQRCGLKIAMTIVIGCFILAEIWLSVRVYQDSQSTVRLLDEVLAKIPATQPAITTDYYSARAVTSRGVIFVVSAHAVLYALLALIIWLLPRGQSPAGSSQGSSTTSMDAPLDD